MNEWLKKLFLQVKELWSKWTVIQKVILIGIIAAGFCGVVSRFRIFVASDNGSFIQRAGYRSGDAR